MKFCNKCKLLKSKNELWVKSKSCKYCRSLHSKIKKGLACYNIKLEELLNKPESDKLCNGCNLRKPFSEYSASKTGKNGLLARCKACITCYENMPHVKERRRKQSREYNKTEKRKEYIRNVIRPKTLTDEHRAKERAYRNERNKTEEGKKAILKKALKSRYNLTLEEHEKMVKTQICCNICQVLFSDSIRPNIDHCHKTGKVRSLLCLKCNWALGALDEDVERFNGLIEYLERDFSLLTLNDQLPENLTKITDRRYRVKRAYNITLEEYYSYFEQADNKCEVCNSEIQLCLDHCHDTLKIRGVLCRACNSSVSYLNDNCETILTAINYLESFR